jgi:hypothetical protein
MADHLLEQTLPIPARDLAAYYQRGVEAGPHDGTVPEVRRDMDPRLAELLRLDPNRTPTRDEIAHVLAGRRGDGNEMPGQPRQIAYIDLCFSADKSVALAWAFAPTEAERNALAQSHRDAVEAAMAYVSTEIGQARRGKAGKAGADPGQVGWIAFDHYASRPTVEIPRTGSDGMPETELVTLKVAGDPNLHTHVAVLNAVLTKSSRIGSLDLQRLDGRIHEFGAYYQAHLAQNLRRLGIETRLDETTGAARLTVIPDEVRDAFSKRTRDAEGDARAYTQKIGRDWDTLSPDEKVDLLKGGAFASRKAKADDLSNFAAWSAQAKELGWRHGTAIRPEGAFPELSREARHTTAYGASLPILEVELRRRAVLLGSDARVAAARGLVASGVEGPADIDAVTKLHRDRGVRQEGRMVGLLWGDAGERGKVNLTTTLHVDQERELIRLAREAADDRSGALSPKQLTSAVERSDLTFAGPHGAAQQEAMQRLGQGGRFAVAIGAAGTGKTTMLRPLVDAWQADGRSVHGVALAWRQSTDLVEAGIPAAKTRALAPFLRAAERGDLGLNRNSVVVVDELGLLGTRQMLDLLRLRERHGFQLAAIGDPLQCQSIEAGPVISLLREALGSGAVPELLTTIRQQTEREREITALLRDGKAEPALAMKREDGTAELVAGGYREAVQGVAALWWERREANRDDPGFSLSVSAPTNADAREIGAAIRARRQAAGEVGPNAMVAKAIDKDGQSFDLPLGSGDRVRLLARTNATLAGGKHGVIGDNGSVLDVQAIRDEGLLVRNARGSEGLVKWDTLRDRESGRVRLTYGDAMTINLSQGVTSTEHIDAMPAGSRAVNGFKAYVSGSRHRRASWLILSDGAERQEVSGRRPLGDSRPITHEDAWANVARNLSRQPEKESALGFLARAQSVRRGAARGLQQGLRPAEQRVVDGQPGTTLHRSFQRHRIVGQVAATGSALNQINSRRTERIRQLATIGPVLRDAVLHAFQRVRPALRRALGRDRAQALWDKTAQAAPTQPPADQTLTQRRRLSR